MTGEETIRNFDKVGADIISDLGIIMLQIAQSANAKIKDRIINSGRNADGQMYAPYSTTPMLTGRSALTQVAYEAKAGTKKKRKELTWVTIKNKGKNAKLFELAGGYKEFREIQGRQTGFVDFAFSGRMWDSVQVISNASQHQKGSAVISTLSIEQMKKLEGHTERKGVLLDLSDEEVDDLQKQVEKWVADIIKRNGL